MNEVHIGCAFVVDIGGKESKSFLVGLMRRRSLSMATVVPGKGVSDGVPSEAIYRIFRRDGAVWSNKTKGLGERNRLGQGTWNLSLKRPPATGLQVGRSNQLKAKFAW